jgi:hypothetical protein
MPFCYFDIYYNQSTKLKQYQKKQCMDRAPLHLLIDAI